MDLVLGSPPELGGKRLDLHRRLQCGKNDRESSQPDPVVFSSTVRRGSYHRRFFAGPDFRNSLRFQQSNSASQITVLRTPENQGYGGNQKLGYRYAIDHGFDFVALIHGDGQYAPEKLAASERRFCEAKQTQFSARA